MSLTSYRAAPPRGGLVWEGVWIGRPGGDLLSRALRHSTMGAGEFHGRVRDGIGCRLPAKTTRSSNPYQSSAVRLSALPRRICSSVLDLLRSGVAAFGLAAFSLPRSVCSARSAATGWDRFWWRAVCVCVCVCVLCVCLRMISMHGVVVWQPSALISEPLTTGPLISSRSGD
jgi:hypothetical protein